MAVLPVTNHIDEDVAVEFLAIAGRNLNTFNNCLYVVTIHMKYRSLDGRCETGRIIGSSCVVEISGKTDLVVDYKMDGATGVISFQATHLQHFINNSLSCNRSISMNENRHDLVILAFMNHISPRPRKSNHHRV